MAVSDREAERLAALRAYDVLGSDPERPYDEITELAAQIAQCPASIISFMDDSHLWPKALYGMPPSKAPLPREMFMCSTAAAGADLLDRRRPDAKISVSRICRWSPAPVSSLL